MKRRLAIAALITVFEWLAVSCAQAEMVVQACFSPRGKCSNYIAREIEQSKKELLVAVYAFTSDELAEAVAQAKRRGVSVQVIIDQEFDARNEKSKGKFLERQQIAVRRSSGIKATPAERENGIMHQKFAIIDRKVLITGSYNWTYAADGLNDENLLLFRDAGALAEEYRKVFIGLWERKR